jgi:hypothetical protein
MEKVQDGKGPKYATVYQFLYELGDEFSYSSKRASIWQETLDEMLF